MKLIESKKFVKLKKQKGKLTKLAKTMAKTDI